MGCSTIKYRKTHVLCALQIAVNQRKLLGESNEEIHRCKFLDSC